MQRCVTCNRTFMNQAQTHCPTDGTPLVKVASSALNNFEALPLATPARASSSGPIQVIDCPACGASTRASNLGGAFSNCEYCGQSFRIADSPTMRTGVMPASYRATPRPVSGFQKFFLIAFIVMFISVFVFILLVFISMRF
ncbi:MAG: hypothetical protein H0X14_02890 [Acidobacteria bacterium]|nr:hypothetical protein [Acidobacteriota bacterium]